MTSAGSADALLRELAVLARTVAPVVSPGGHEELLRSLTATARALFGARACSLALLEETDDDSADEELVYVAASGAGSDAIVGARIGATQGIAGFVLQSGQPVAVSDLRNDARFARGVAESTGYVPQAILAVPVVGSSGPLGVLTLLDRDARREGAQFDIETAGLFADQAALAIEGARAAADVGRMLLTQLAAAADGASGLTEALQSAADAAPDDSMLALATLLARLAARSESDMRLAARIVNEFLRAGAERPTTR